MKTKFTVIGLERLRMETDGDGVTTLVCGYGCPLRCSYCLNPHCFLKKQTDFKSYEVEELIDVLKIDSLYFEATSGGVVFGGGEPLLQADFIHEFKKNCPSVWNIYLESSLNVPKEQFLKVIDDIDAFIIDIKDMNPDIYKAYSGIDNENVIRNLKLLVERGYADKVKVRIPLIPEYNTDEDRDKSIQILTEMGFTNFDRFPYNVTIAKQKRDKIK